MTKAKAPAVVQPWRPFLALGCSHGFLIDDKAADAVLTMQERLKPKLTVHLGDAFDTTAFRRGAHGAEASADVGFDMDSGLTFLKRLKPDVYLLGNHEDRIWQLQSDPCAKVKELSSRLVDDIERACRAQKTRVIEYNYKARYQVADYSFLHGTVFGENCARDAAEMWGNCIFAHAHRAGIGKGRRADNPTGYCVGHLMDVNSATYAKTRRSTLSWSQGFVWGEYCDKRLVCWLHEHPQGQTEWRLPI